MLLCKGWAEQQLSHQTWYDTQPNNTPDSQASVTTNEVTPGAGQAVDVAADETPAPSTSTPESSPKPASPSPSPLELLVATAVTDQARTLGVLASRVETLETQLAILQQERDNFVQQRLRALDQLAQVQAVPTNWTQQLEQLQAENSQLRSQLERFEAIRRAFMGETPLPQSADDTGASALASTQADSTDTKASAPASETPAVDTTSNGAFANQNKSSPKSKSNSSTKAVSSVSPRRRGAALARAENIFRALIAWNSQHPTDTFAMTDWLLEGVFNVNRKAAKQFCQDFHQAIAQHHLEVGIDNTRSHNRGRDTSALKAFVGGLAADS